MTGSQIIIVGQIVLLCIVIYSIIRAGSDESNRLKHEILSHLSRKPYSGRALRKLIRLKSPVRFYHFMEFMENDGFVVHVDTHEEIDGVQIRVRRFEITQLGREKLTALDSEIEDV